MICFLLPTNDYETMKTLLMPSLPVLTQCRDLVCFAINFQDYTDSQIAETLSAFDAAELQYKYIVSKYPKPARRGLIKFNKIRHDCATLYPDAKIYGLCDDDFVFGEDSDLMLVDVLNFFAENPSAGIVQCCKMPIFVPHCYSERSSKYHNYFTANGFFFRNECEKIGGLLFPPSALENEGACEEFIIGFELTKHGYKTFVRTKSTIDHLRNVDASGVSPYHWGSNEIMFSALGNFKYINENYRNKGC